MEKLSDLIITKYPRSIALGDGTQVTLRPMMKDDEQALLAYFQNLPAEDRLCLKEDVTDPNVIQGWILDLNYDHILPIVATDNGRIIGDATLHFSPIGWNRHEGEIRLTTDPHYRVKGLGTQLIEELIDCARELGLEQISAEIPPMLDKAFYLFEKMGFKEAAVLEGFVRDMGGTESALVLMVKFLNEDRP
jgi:GNAT superfamily N-acetyltransferase